jgi:hypothetical protein
MKSTFAGMRPRTGALGVLTLALLGFGVLSVWRGTQTASLLATPARRVAPPAALPGTPTSVSPALGTVQDHALFHATRRYIAPLDPRSQPTIPPTPDYQLAGTFTVPNKPSVALLKNKTAGSSRQVRTGDALDGWQVTGIESRRILLKYGEQVIEITSANATGTTSPSSPAPGSASAQPSHPPAAGFTPVPAVASGPPTTPGSTPRMLGSVRTPAVATPGMPTGRPRIVPRPL